MLGDTAIYHDTPSFKPRAYNCRVLWLVVLSCCNLLAAAADDAKHIANLHAENWRQTLQAGNLEEVLALYDPSSALLIGPDGVLAGSPSDMTAFWRSFIDKGGVKTRIQVLDAHFNVAANRQQDNTVVARLVLSKEQNNMNLAKRRWHVDSILKRQANGQWKTQLQNWY